LAQHNAENPDQQVYLSSGVATANPGEPLQETLQRADRAMYEEKRQRGRTRTPGAMPAVRER
jgi:PleD family two-component response regulator